MTERNETEVLEQADFFPTPESTRIQQLVEGERRKRVGLATVGGNNAPFLRQCRAFARQFAESRGSVGIEDVRRWAAIAGLEPTHHNAWGAVFKEAMWEPCGVDKNAIPSAHARRVLRWRTKEARP